MLIRKLREGDANAFKDVYECYYRQIVNYFYYKTHSREDALDLLQECFYKLWRYRTSLSPDFSIEQQLFFIAKQLVIDYYRKSKSNFMHEDEDSGVFQIPFDPSIDNIISNELKDRLNPILNQMPLLRRKIFVLNKFEGYTYKEIAGYYAITEKAVENHIYKALKFIKIKLFLFFITFLF